MQVKSLKIRGFRNLVDVNLNLPQAGVYVLYGANGAGKTNLLEALSLLSPGQGLHRDKLDNMLGESHKQWSVFAEVENFEGLHKVGMLYSKKRRHIRLDGQDLSQQADLAKLGSVLWFTPEMDRLFQTSPAGRRRFFDRLTFGINPAHAQNLSRYTRHIQNRAKVLKTPNPDSHWLELEEQQAATFAAKVVQARLQTLEALTPFMPEVVLVLKGSAEKYTQEVETDEELVELYTNEFIQRRERDARFGGTSFGPHRSDLEGELIDITPLNRASMGQHKRAMLLILFAAAQYQKQQTGQAPCLLLDEVATHLDEAARGILYDQLLPLGGQVWLTGTEKSYFNKLSKVQFIHMMDGMPK